MHRAIPPDLSHARLPLREASQQREAVGDLHLAADNFSGAVDEYGAALRAIHADAPAERCFLLLKLADVETRRGESEAALIALREDRKSVV